MSSVASDQAGALLTLCLAGNRAWDKGQTLHICMLDLTKASDAVDKGMAWQILLSRGASPKRVALIRGLHMHHSAVICNAVDSAPVDTSDEFNQKCVLAPSLFNVCLDSVFRQLLPELRRLGVTFCYKLDGQLVQILTEEVLMWILLYADDISWRVTPLRSSGKLSLPWTPHFCFGDLQSVQRRPKCWLLAEMLQLKLQIQSSCYPRINWKWSPT